MRIIYVYDRLYLYAWSMTYVINIIYHIIINYFYPVRVYDRTNVHSFSGFVSLERTRKILKNIYYKTPFLNIWEQHFLV